MKKRVVKELEIDVCDICESEVDNGFYGLYDKHICGYCFETTLRDFIESQKKNIKPTV